MLETINDELKRLRNIFQKMDFLSACKYFWFLVYKTLRPKSHKFELTKDRLKQRPESEHFQIKLVKSFNELSKEQLQILQEEMLYNTIYDLKNYFTENEVMWLGFYQEKLASYTFILLNKEKKEALLSHSETFARYRGKGLSPLLLYLICKYYFENGYKKIFSIVHFSNKQSIRVKDKLGFKKLY